ncbi:hypothetical protein H310_07083 [Aphanomyces invadans]|uniref:FYVE-type domain-containing protein n=1 Tax=Aphanomyces invadans TaxID=157072 RepID=A0A024U3K8_9STRA|nr:hypothetical protein H310_07083 [Aphanomyces invadans]ETW00462.1 hypothetical protein H310_07083 [Aphanomyces invadans]|eukprot:XP_008870597.1 hypothetical protein H310_07083 [Aphanomyces invadans]
MTLAMSMGTMNQVFVDGASDEAPRILRQDQLMLPHLYAPLKSTSACHECTKAFTTFRRKYNCQMCGEVVCRNCTVAYVAEVSNDVIDAKVCMSCVSIVEAEYHAAMPTAAAPQRSSPRASHFRHTSLSASNQSSSACGDHGGFSVESQLEELRTTRSLPATFTALVAVSSSSSTEENLLPGHNYPVQLVTATTAYDYILDFNWANPWPKPPVVANDAQRVQVLRSYPILDGVDHVSGFDAICEFACNVLHCPVAIVSVIDDKYQRFQASVGLAQDKIPRNVAFCAHALLSKEPMAVLDTTQDERFKSNPMVTGAGIRFYASAPICAPSGHVLGTVCVMDQVTHPNGVDLSLLEVLANVVMKKMDDSERRRLPSISAPTRPSSSEDGGKVSRRNSSGSSTRVHRTSSSGHDLDCATQHLDSSERMSTMAAIANTGIRDNVISTDAVANHHHHQQFFISPDELKPRTQWVSDSKRHICQVCSRKFSMLLRKHHCRLCGEVICKHCAMSTMLVKQDKMVAIMACMECLRTRSGSVDPATINNSSSISSRHHIDVDSIILHPRRGGDVPSSLESDTTLKRLATSIDETEVVDEPEPAEFIPVLLRHQAYDVDTNSTMYSNHNLILEPRVADVTPPRDFTQQEIQSMLVRLLSQSNDIQQQISQTAAPPPASSHRSTSR